MNPALKGSHKAPPAMMGQILMIFMLATALSGELNNIKAFNQPGVDLGRKVTKEWLGRS